MLARSPSPDTAAFCFFRSFLVDPFPPNELIFGFCMNAVSAGVSQLWFSGAWVLMVFHSSCLMRTEQTWDTRRMHLIKSYNRKQVSLWVPKISIGTSVHKDENRLRWQKEYQPTLLGLATAPSPLPDARRPDSGTDDLYYHSNHNESQDSHQFDPVGTRIPPSQAFDTNTPMTRLISFSSSRFRQRDSSVAWIAYSTNHGSLCRKKEKTDTTKTPHLQYSQCVPLMYYIYIRVTEISILFFLPPEQINNK